MPWHSRTFHVIIASSLMGVMGVSLISPVLPELRHAFGVADTQVGLVITAFTFPGIFLTPVIGLVADRIGRKRVLVPLLMIFGVSGVAIAFTTDFTVVLVLRVCQGIGATALVMLAVTLIGDIYEGAQLDAVVGINGSMIGIGAAFFPLVGGLLAVVAWYVPFLFYGVGVLVGVVALVVIQEPTREDAMDVRTYLDRLLAIARLPRILAIFVALFVTVFVFYGGVITALPLLLSDEFGLGPGTIGPILAAIAVTEATIASQYGRLAQIRTGPELVTLGFVAYGSGFLLLWVTSSIAVIVVALLAFGVGFGVIFPSIDSTLITDSSEDLRAGVMGMRTSMLRIGQTLGPVGFTGAAEAFFVTTLDGYRTLFFVTGAVVLVGGTLAYVRLRR
ncbi:MFS transporter [Natrarchaeobius chitinivorans]|uniref:MFS transporter n=1 Tax=Natrarchaeobius chitinivorans TaxID=1679083 RepID=A0A3N6M1S7_NATCH|nr:MFS transporter [Natrarchaeobius chitinivorans]